MRCAVATREVHIGLNKRKIQGSHTCGSSGWRIGMQGYSAHRPILKSYMMGGEGGAELKANMRGQFASVGASRGWR